MNGIRNKLGSDRGASITFALLLFLVCAVVSSVVVVAATTSAGRLSQLAQMDQRYYAVNSAAELLCDAFMFTDDAGKPVEVTVTYDKAADALETDLESEEERPLLAEATKALAETLLDLESEEEEQDLDGGATFSHQLSVTAGAGEGATTLECALNETLVNGLLQTDISNTTGSDAGVYTLRVTLASNVRRYADDPNKVTVSWKLHSIQKVRADEKTAE